MTLSDFELEVMQLLWKEGETTAPIIHKILLTKREVAYSTVKTIIDRLENKKAIKRSRMEGRTIYFLPLIENKHLKPSLIKSFINRVFLGDSKPLVTHIIEEEELTLEDIEYLESILKKRKNKVK